MNKSLKILENEYWYGLATDLGSQLPLGQDSSFEYNFTTSFTGNQECSYLVSSKGRYIFSSQPFDIKVSSGRIQLSSQGDIEIVEGKQDLRGAYLALAEAHFMRGKKCPPKAFFTKPQFNTWIEMLKQPSQEGVIAYAKKIKEHFQSGIIMLDDGWMKYYGSREFTSAFDNVQAMNKTLHALGFKVMLWVSPFITPNTPTFADLEKRNLLVKDSAGKVALRQWWNETSAVLDLSNPEAQKWFASYLAHFEKLGFDGFKFDAGDANYYSDDDQTYGGVSAHEQCALWAKFGAKYRFNELRASYNVGGYPLVQRLRDKPHDYSSLKKIVSDTLAAGIIGHAYTCPDMIGGGLDQDFISGDKPIDQDLFVSFAEISSALAMMQFSAAPWRVLDEKHLKKCKNAVKSHQNLSKTLLLLAKHASKTCEPIIRYMEYVFPSQDFEKVTDQFMIGDKIMCSPLFDGASSRTVTLPEGQWKHDGKTYEGGKQITLSFSTSAPLFYKI